MLQILYCADISFNMQKGNSPLYAATDGHTEVVKRLLDHGADVNQANQVLT